MDSRTVAIGILSAAGLAAFIGVGLRAPEVRLAYTLRKEETSAEILALAEKKALPQEALNWINTYLEEAFGTYEAPKMPDTFGIPAANLVRGRDFYRKQCLHCHGVTGDGNGTTAPFMSPHPRDYRRGLFKITSTAAGMKPRREDLVRTVRQGLPGTLMPAFNLFDDATIEAVTDYVIHLSVRGETEILMFQASRDAIDEGEEPEESLGEDALSIVAGKWQEAETGVVNPTVPRPPATPESVAIGREIFLSPKTNCFGCHGAGGKGDGGSVPRDPTGRIVGFSDDWGNVILPADLTQGIYRGGARPLDLWRRIYAGVKGTQMPSHNSALTEEQIWHVVNFLENLRTEKTR